MGLRLEVPSYSTLCRRLGSLRLILWQDIQRTDRLHVVVDSTGLKVYGEGEWKVRIHGVDPNGSNGPQEYITGDWIAFGREILRTSGPRP
jgi:hypothetical protein